MKIHKLGSLTLVKFSKNSSLIKVILFLQGTQALPNKPDIVIGTRDTQFGNNIQLGPWPHRNGLSTGSNTVLGSQTIQTDGRYVTFGRVNKSGVLLPSWYNHVNEVPRSLTELISGPSTNAIVMSSGRRQQIQEKLTSLITSCQQMKTNLYQLRTTKNFSTATGIIRNIILIEIRLQQQQKFLNDFNNVMYLNHQKTDHFDTDLNVIQLEIEQLMIQSLLLIQPQN